MKHRSAHLEVKLEPVYQTHSVGQKAMSDSFKKLERLRFPRDMKGKRFLDIGCNEGFFCNVAAERGAQVIGIDFYGPSLDFARERYQNPSIEFRLQKWDALPDGPFDYVLWSSSMHYELDPARVLREISQRLSPNGVLILECGVVNGLSREMVRVNRHSDARWYPTLEFLTEDLLGTIFAFRQVAWPEVTDGDPTPRSVFHCRRRLPVVALIRGASGEGKSTLALRLKPISSKSVLLDLFFYRIHVAQFHHTEFDKFVRDNFKQDDLTSLYKGIDSSGLTEDFAAVLAEGIAPSDEAVIIDGAMTDAQADAFSRVLGNNAIVWDMRRLSNKSKVKSSDSRGQNKL
jgi:SAM-dependent methyltransferase